MRRPLEGGALGVFPQNEEIDPPYPLDELQGPLDRHEGSPAEHLAVAPLHLDPAVGVELGPTKLAVIHHHGVVRQQRPHGGAVPGSDRAQHCRAEPHLVGDGGTLAGDVPTGQLVMGRHEVVVVEDLRVDEPPGFVDFGYLEPGRHELVLGRSGDAGQRQPFAADGDRFTGLRREPHRVPRPRDLGHLAVAGRRGDDPAEPVRHHGVARREEILELIGATFVLRRHPFGVAPGDQVLDLSPPALEASRAELVEASERRVELVVVEDLLVGQSALGVALADEQLGPGLPVAVLTRAPRGHDVQRGRPRDERLGQGQRGVRHRRRERAHAIHVGRPIPARPQPAMIDRHEVRAEVRGDRIPVAYVERRHELRSASDQRRRGGRVVHDEVALLEIVERRLQIVIAEEQHARDQTSVVELEYGEHGLLEVLPEPGGDVDERQSLPTDRQGLDARSSEAELGVDAKVGHDGVSADEIDSSDRPRVEEDGALCQEQAELIDLPGGDECGGSVTDAGCPVLDDRCP